MKIRQKTNNDYEVVKKLVTDFCCAEMAVIRGKEYYPAKMDGFVAEDNNEIVGYLIYENQGEKYEIIIFEALQKFKGIGTQLLNAFKKLVKEKGVSKIVVMTTNDDLDALRFYQKRGFVICGIDVNAMEKSRKAKPSIPMTGDYGIPLRDEIYLEMEV